MEQLATEGGTYFLAGALLGVSAFMFKAGELTAATQTIWWCVIFFFASAGASAAYLTCSEIFPLEVRAKAIAVLFCTAQALGAVGPWLYGQLIGNGTDHFLHGPATDPPPADAAPQRGRLSAREGERPGRASGREASEEEADLISGRARQG